MRKRIIAFVSIIMCAMMFAGCKNTLEKKISKKQLEEMNEEAYNTYAKNNESIKDIKIEIKGNDIKYKYYYNMDFTDDQVEAMQKNLNTSANQKMVESQKKSLVDAFKIKDITVSFVYYDKNDKEIASISA